MVFSLSSCNEQSGDSGSTEMNGDNLERNIRQLVSSKVSRQGNALQWEVDGITLICIFDENANRMRIISPVQEMAHVTDQEVYTMMESNFHAALDARYATSGGMLYSTFIHPLSSLSRNDLKSAIDQVYTLNLTFGKDYTSGALVFGGNK